MNTIYKYIHIFLIGLFSWACAQIEEQPFESEDNLELVDLTFVASIEDDFTKTILDGQVGDGTHHVLWCPEDKIDIVPILETSFLEYTFNNTSEEYSRTVMFEGRKLSCILSCWNDWPIRAEL